MVYIPTMHIPVAADEWHRKKLLQEQHDQMMQMRQQQMQLAQMKQEAFMREQQQAQQQQQVIADMYAQAEKQKQDYAAAMAAQKASPVLQNAIGAMGGLGGMPVTPDLAGTMTPTPVAPKDAALQVADKLMALGQPKMAEQYRKMAQPGTDKQKQFSMFPAKVQEDILRTPAVAKEYFPHVNWDAIYAGAGPDLKNVSGRLRDFYAINKRMPSNYDELYGRRRTGPTPGPGPLGKPLSGRWREFTAVKDGKKDVGDVYQRGGRYFTRMEKDGVATEIEVIPGPPITKSTAGAMSDLQQTAKQEALRQKIAITRMENLKADLKDPGKRVKVVQKYKEMFQKLPVVKDYESSLTNMAKMNANLAGYVEDMKAGRPVAASSFMTLFGFIKSADNSVVRASEEALFRSLYGLRDQIAAWQKKFGKDGGLPQNYIEDMVRHSQRLTDAVRNTYDGRVAFWHDTVLGSYPLTPQEKSAVAPFSHTIEKFAASRAGKRTPAQRPQKPTTAAPRPAQQPMDVVPPSGDENIWNQRW